MNEEAAVAYLALLLRVGVVGGLLLVLPRIARKGLLFGVHVGEERAKADDAHRLRRDWNRGCVAVMVAALAVGLTIGVAVGDAVVGNLIGTGVLLLLALALYIKVHSRARAMIPPGAAQQAEMAAAPLNAKATRAEATARLTLVVCVLTALVTATYSMIAVAEMPDRVPALSDAFTGRGELVDKSIVAVMFFPALNLIASPFYALLALLTATAKRSVRVGSRDTSVDAQDSFQSAATTVTSGLALFTCALLTLVSVQIVRFEQSKIESLGVGIWWLAGALIIFMASGLIRIMKRYGQGGALIEASSAASPLTGGLADEARWRGGLFYVNRDDPSIMIEKRFGIGYTFNYGNKTAVLIVATFLTLLVSLITVGLIELLL
jgi:uncharacterized membrane protein